MKQIIFICLTILASSPSFAQFGWDVKTYPGVPLTTQDNSDIWATVLFNDNTVFRKLEQGTVVLGETAALNDKINDVFEDIAIIMYEGNRYAIRTGNLRPLGDGRLPENWITAPDAQRKWVISYYLDALRSQDRGTFMNYEQSWIEWRTENLEWIMAHEDLEGTSLRWYSDSTFNFESLVFYNAVVIMGGFNRFNFFITAIASHNTGYKVTMFGDRRIVNIIDPDFWQTFQMPLPLWSERQSFDLIFIPDGDFMDVYLDSPENHFATFAKVDAVILEELENLVQTNEVDLSRITSWPRRADGTMDIPPPIDMSGFRASHTATARLRVRDEPTTASLIVTTLPLGLEVQVLETGSVSTINEITAPWVKLLSAEGHTGWSFSGYLQPIAASVGATATQPAAARLAPPRNTAVDAAPATRGLPPFSWLVIGGGAVFLLAVVAVIVPRKR